jgi:serine/threonine-protein kinase
MSNIDLAILVNLPTFLVLWLLPIFIKTSMLQSLPGILTLLPLGIVAGFASVAVIALFRLVFQLLYGLL